MTAATLYSQKKVKAKSTPALTRRGQQRQEVLLAVAAEHFLRHGYQGSSLDAIVAEAGGSKGAIYRHFNGKEGLFSAVVEQLCYEFLTDLRAIDVSQAPLDDGLRLILHELVRVLAAPRHAAFYRLIIAGSAQFPEAGKTWYEHGPAVWFDVLMRLFDAQRQQGLMADGVPAELVARALFDAVLSNLTTQFVILGRPINIDSATPLIEELICMTQARFDFQVSNTAQRIGKGISKGAGKDSKSNKGNKISKARMQHTNGMTDVDAEKTLQPSPSAARKKTNPKSEETKASAAPIQAVKPVKPVKTAKSR